MRERHDDAVPVTVQTLIQARLDRLDASDREALRAASVLGQRFSLEALRAILGQPGYEPFKLIQRLLLRSMPEGLLFAHALIHDAVYDLLLAAQRRELHLRAAAFFAGQDAPLHAQHLDRAGDPDAPQAYAAAARQQAEAYRNEAAVELALRGMELAVTTADRFALACLAGRLQLDLGRGATGRRGFRVRPGLCRRRRRGQCQARLGLAESMRLLDRLDEALTHLADAEAAARARATRPSCRASIICVATSCFRWAASTSASREHKAALTMPDKPGRPSWRPRAWAAWRTASM